MPSLTGCHSTSSAGTGLRQLHRAAGVPRRPWSGLCAARRVVLRAHARRRYCGDVRGRGEEAAEGQAGPGCPLGRPGLEGRALGRLGLDQCQARLYTAVLRHIVLVTGCTRGLRRHRRTAQGQYGNPGHAACRAGRPAARRPRSCPAQRPGDQAAARRSTGPAETARAHRRWLHWRRRHQARSRWFHQRAHLARNYTPGQLAIEGCRTGGRRAVSWSSAPPRGNDLINARNI